MEKSDVTWQIEPLLKEKYGTRLHKMNYPNFKYARNTHEVVDSGYEFECYVATCATHAFGDGCFDPERFDAMIEANAPIYFYEAYRRTVVDPETNMSSHPLFLRFYSPKKDDWHFEDSCGFGLVPNP